MKFYGRNKVKSFLVLAVLLLGLLIYSSPCTAQYSLYSGLGGLLGGMYGAGGLMISGAGNIYGTPGGGLYGMYGGLMGMYGLGGLMGMYGGLMGMYGGGLYGMYGLGGLMGMYGGGLYGMYGGLMGMYGGMSSLLPLLQSLFTTPTTTTEPNSTIPL